MSFDEAEKAAVEDALAITSVSDCNKRGWVRPLLTRNDASKLQRLVSEMFTNRKVANNYRTKDGKLCLPINNKLMFIKGTNLQNVTYTHCIVFNAQNSNEMEFFTNLFLRGSINDFQTSILNTIIKRNEAAKCFTGFTGEYFKATRQNVSKLERRAILPDGYFGYADNQSFIYNRGSYREIESGTPANLLDVERLNLVAVHNTREDKLIKALALEGLPGLSTAVINIDNGLANEGYGDISLVFDKDTIDPKRAGNAVYGADI